MNRKWWTLAVVCAATFMLLLDVTIVVVALPDIQTSLKTDFGEVQWVTDAYALSLAALLLTSGVLADRFGRRRLFLVGMVVFTLGSALCAAAQSPAMLIWSRAAQGVGGSILFSTSLALLATTFHGRERGVAFGSWGAVTGVSTALGPLLGGLITSGISWRGVFWVNLPIGIVAIALAVARVQESRSPHPSRPDWGGFATLTIGLFTLVYGLIRAGQDGWSEGRVWVCFAVAVVALAAFVAVEARHSHPMFDLGLLRTPTFVGGSAAAFAMNGSLFAMVLYLTVYLQNDLGYSALQAGLRLLPIFATSMVAATVAGRISSHVPVRLLVGPGLLLVGAGLLLMTRIGEHTTWTALVPGFLVAGLGSGLVNPPLASTAVGVVPVHRSGMASGVNSTFRQVGIAVGIAAYGTLYGSSLRSHHTVAHALDQLFLVSGAVAVVGGLLALALIRSRDFVAHGPARPTPAETTSVS
ncbi:MFS transporter [Phycicoccus endophyticus]|uniref:MFS transporter n=1 Tax=Phycicoccus endophyticus TaxID=1690220 RepID=A0A7G9QZU5_9MICO|nr:MFS transporter [Phycicoccus endophyticus]NHI20070.1 MFS transporter [Phycicoccus endophyticus]QNN48870.1 MFS transporter [Phycicoccus endophyticus]GGL45669.1 MFS transporter [Phycicoccus endophyticus]